MSFGTLIHGAARAHQLDPNLIAGVIHVESSGDKYAARYEPLFFQKYIAPTDNKDLPGVFPGHPTTERHLRTISWGLMQIMGNTARLHGFAHKYLTALLEPELNIYLGAKILADCLKKTENDPYFALLRWNGGGDERYPDRVLGAMERGEHLYLLENPICRSQD